MFAKKFMIALLVLGALLIVILLGVGYKFSSKVRVELQNTLNEYLQEASKDESGILKDNVAMQYQPFVCTGISNYECKTQEISFINKKTNQTLVKLSDLTLGINDIQTSSVEFSLKSSKISFDALDKQVQEGSNQSLKEIYKSFMPDSFECHQKAQIHSKDIGEIKSSNTCVFKSKGTQYHYELSGVVKSPIFEGKTILNDIVAYYSKINPLNTDSQNNEFEFSIDKVSFSLVSSDLKDVLYPIFERDYNSQNKDAKPPFDDKIYANGIANLKGLVGVFVGVFGGFPNTYTQALGEFVNGLEGMANNKVKEVDLALLPKKTPPPFFKPSSEMLLNADKTGVQQRIFAKILNNYNLTSKSVLNASK